MRISLEISQYKSVFRYTSMGISLEISQWESISINQYGLV